MDWIKWDNLCKGALKFSEGYPRYCLLLLLPLHRKGLPLQHHPRIWLKLGGKLAGLLRAFLCSLSPIAMVTVWSMFSKMAQISRDFILYSRSDLLHSFFNLFIFNWRIIALQCCDGFCHTSKWISHKHTYVRSLFNLPPTPSHLSRLSQSTGFELPESRSKFPLSIYFTYGNVCFSATLSVYTTLSFPLWVHKSVLCVCISFAVLHIGSSVPPF